ncbi:MAG: hypothetical protein ABSE53_11730 [Terracidiphilus sp.]|jgi:hypothetical protein
MFCTIKSPAQRRWVRSCWISAALVVPLVIGAAAAFRLYHLRGFPAYVVAVLPTLPILWVLVELGRYLAVEKDEFQRNILVQCVLGGTGGTLATTTIWGYLEDFARAPHLDLVYIYLIFWLWVLVSYPVVRLRYK